LSRARHGRRKGGNRTRGRCRRASGDRIDPADGESCEIGKQAARAGDTSIWVLLSPSAIASLGQDLRSLEPSREIRDRCEGWVDGEVFAQWQAGVD
jgi:hypothetical protein